MGYDGKYGNITTEKKSVPDDEPVIMFRAQDQLLVPLLEHYWQLCADYDASDDHLDAVTETCRRVASWQQENSSKVRIPTTLPGEYQ